MNMTQTLSRRQFLATSAALGATALPGIALSQTAPLTLTATSRVLDIAGRAVSVFGLTNSQGGQGLILDPGQRFRVDLINDLAEETLIHWHGQLPPNAQDGVPGLPMPALRSGESRSYDFAANPGTHWMHSHIPLQEMALLAAPLIVRDAAGRDADRQEVAMFLHDLSFLPGAEVLAQITGGMTGHDMAAMGAGQMDHSQMDMSAGSMDLNDFEFDAYLVNDRTLADPQVVQIENSARVLLRIINAAAATTFWIDTGLPARLVAVDGQPVEPLTGTRFGVAMAQRLDIELDLPNAGAFPILALREGVRQQTGLILATPGAKIAKFADLADAAAPAFDRDMAQELSLRALHPLPNRAAARSQQIMLTGSMAPYLWSIDGQTWPNHTPITARSGERVELTFHNMSMMAHPMHLHGHVFQVVGINGRTLNGARRDTVLVPPMAQVTVALDAGEAARWMLHCHHMPHLFTGMMTEFAVSA